jgi:hypothetical protein
MCADKTDPYHLITVVDPDYQAIMISFNIKNHTVPLQKRCSRIFFFNLFGAFPGPFTCFLIPRFKLFCTIRMFNPEFPKNLFRNNSQAILLPKLRKSSHFGKFNMRFIYTLANIKKGVTKTKLCFV